MGIGKFRKVFRASLLGLFQKNEGEMIWQQEKRQIRSTQADLLE